RYLIDFHVTDGRGKVIGYRNLSELRRRIAPVMLRRDRTLVRDQLPERIEQRLDVPMTVRQRELHDAALSAAGKLAQIARRRPLTPSEQHRLMAALQQARMACDAAELVDKETKGSPKLEELEALLEQLCLQNGLKVVIFSQWERMTALVEQVVRRLKIGCVRLHGGVPTGRRGELMDRFREDEATQVFISTDAGGTGLNLQSASVLINLDIPWNPAVLDQRIARVHRLGQTDTVQIILMVAEDSYEERVLKLAQGKRELFTNVVGAEATEEVVGVSRKLLETLAEDLAGAEEPRQPAPADDAPVPEATVAAGERPPPPATPGEDASLNRCIADIQSAFGPRIERILGARGGLLVVMDPIDVQADRIAEGLSDTVPVALIDSRTFNGLQRLGAASPLGETRTYYAPDQERTGRGGSALLRLARERLRAAETLLGQDCPSAAGELLTSAMLSAAAAIAGLSQPPTIQEAAVWIYSEALPKGALTADQANDLLRASALSQAPSLPRSLLDEVLEDARRLLDQAE
ncbi:MAG: DEAD/DEAH box helicase, partial [Chromatiales bacterium]